MNGQEHLGWCVDRALEYYDRGEHIDAVGSFISDVSKHPATRHISGLEMPILMLAASMGRRRFARQLFSYDVCEDAGNPCPPAE